jgi:hypothetical protein
MIKKSHFFSTALARHSYYFLGYQLINIITHLVILSVVIFFHFLLEHRLADIQDWIFFHGWEILILGKLLSLGIMSRFMGILSNERSPLINILAGARGIVRTELFVGMVIMTLGLMIVGKPLLQETYKWSLYPLLISYIGLVVLLGSDALILLVLNKSIPLKRKAWTGEIILFSLISFLIHKMIFLFGLAWDSHIIFSFIFIFYCLKLRGEFVWIHSLIFIVAFLAPLFTIFGMDPLWANRFSPLFFSESSANLGFAVFSLVVISFLRAKKLNLIPS